LCRRNTTTYIWDTTNTLLAGYQGATGIKTGYTVEAGYCLVFSATHADHHLLGVVLNDTGPAARFTDAQALLAWGFNLPLLAPS
jgi:D-alanyl-D-alanine carboxypeptidase (penicillin-binding protein 5/6)